MTNGSMPPVWRFFFTYISENTAINNKLLFILKLIDSRLKVQRSGFKGYSSWKLLTRLIKLHRPESTHWMKKLYDNGEDRIYLITADWEFFTWNVEP